MNIGDFKTRKSCRFCSSEDLILVIDLGYTPLAGDFLKKEQISQESLYPLRVFLCQSCFLVQVIDIIPSNVLFDDYRYLSSIGLSQHFNEYAKEIVNQYLTLGDFVVEIGSNDGVLLLPLKNMGMQVLGIDPAENVNKLARSKGIESITGYFNQETVKKIVAQKGKSKAILANNVLAHIDNMDEVIKGVNILLSDDGILVFEVHYLIDLIKKLQYDFFYQEHLCYYSLTALIPFFNKYGFEIFDVKKIDTHSGSIRVFVKRAENNKLEISSKFKAFLEIEKKMKINHVSTYSKFMKKVKLHKNKFNKLLYSVKSKNKKVIGYGASGRANTLLNYCKIDNTVIDYIVDASPERYGRFMPQSHIPIFSPEYFHLDKSIDCIVILAWNYSSMIMNKERLFLKGKDVVIPLPKIGVLENKYE